MISRLSSLAHTISRHPGLKDVFLLGSTLETYHDLIGYISRAFLPNHHNIIITIEMDDVSPIVEASPACFHKSLARLEASAIHVESYLFRLFRGC
jgi:hypothetical protein